VSLLFPYHSSPLVSCANYWWSLFCCCRSDLVWKMIGGFFLIWMLMESFVYLVLYSWLLSVSSRALPHSRWVSVTDFYVLFEFLFVISTMFGCGIVVFVGLIDCYIVRCAFWAVYSLLLWLFHVLSAVLLSSLIIVILIMGSFLFLVTKMYVVDTNLAPVWKWCMLLICLFFQ
jgi:hypothetical protein